MSDIDVLVVTDPDDDHGAAILAELASRGVVSARLNLSDLPHVRLKAHGTLTEVRLDSVWSRLPPRSTVWWRRAGRVDVTGLAPDEASLLLDEAPHVLRGALCALGVRFVDDPFTTDRAEHKLAQLGVAEGLALRTPPTLVTSDVDAAREFSEHRRLVAKALSPGVGIAPYADEVFSNDLDRVTNCPTLLQELTESAADLRVVVVGTQAWAWRRPREDGTLDWRSVDPSGAAFEPVRDAALCRSAIGLTSALGLSMSVQDWLESEDGPIFLEANPQGSWLFLRGSRERIVAALADHLLGEVENPGKWPSALKRFFYDFLPAKYAPENDGVVAPTFRAPNWAEVAAVREDALETARLAHEDAKVGAQTAEDKSNRLTQAALALATLSLALGAFQLEFALQRSSWWLLSLGPIAAAMVCLLLAAFESLEIDRVGVYGVATAEDLVEIGARDPTAVLIELEEQGRRAARWTSIHKHTDLMQARAWFSRGLAALVIAALLALVFRAIA